MPCIGILLQFKIVEIDASDLGFGGIMKQKFHKNEKKILFRFISRKWNNAQLNYLTIKKEILSIVSCISKFQNDLLNQ